MSQTHTDIEAALAARFGQTDYYERLGRENMAPLWVSLSTLVPVSPNAPTVPAYWDYDGVARPLLMEAGKLITAEEAERRVLILENPGIPGKASITNSLYGGLQMVLPNEIAVAHRHAPSALRFIIEGSGAYTTVNGERAFMEPGDLILTPSMTWHDHGNETREPVVWLDALDIPVVQFLDAGFLERNDSRQQGITRPSGDSDVAFGSNLAPVDWKPGAKASPIYKYPYERSRQTLEAMARNRQADPCHGHKMRYVNPATGGYVLPTVGTFIQILEKGFTTDRYRSSDGTVYAVIEGTGSSTIGGKTFNWKPRDIFVAPSWAWQTHTADTNAVIFSFSDRPIQEALGLWRDQRGRANE